MEKSLEGTALEKVLLIGFYISGYAALTYEILWIHLLSLIYGSSTYSYAILLGAFLFGLGIGSYVFGKVAERIKNHLVALGWIELGVAFTSILVLPFFEHIDVLYLRFARMVENPGLIPVGWILIPSFLIIPTSLMGAKFPIAAKFYSTSKKTRGREMGLLFASNTLGAVFASWWTGFVLLPTIGLEHTYLLAAISNFTVAVLIFSYILGHHWSLKGSIRAATLIISVLFVLTVSLTHGREIDTRFAGVFYIAQDMEIEEWVELKKNSNIIYNKYGVYGLVTVGEDSGVKYLSVDGKPEASNGPLDLDGQYFLGYIPMFSHPNPRRVLHIGTGAGFTLDAIRNFDVERIDAVEINPLVIKAAEEYFTEETNMVSKDQKINFILGDGRRFLSRSKDKYDIIITTPSNPWVSGSSYLFTVEFYETVKEHLEEGGIFSAWAPLYEYDFEDISIYLNTLRRVFPEVNVFIAGGDMIMIASNEPLEINYQRMVDKMREQRIASHLSNVGNYYGPQIREEEKLTVTYRFNTEDIERFVPETDLNVDDRPVLEFRAARRAILDPFNVDKYLDIIHKVHEFKDTFTPPLSGLVVDGNGEREFKHINLRVKEGENWILDTVVYDFYYYPSPSLLSYYPDKYVRYYLPEDGALFVIQANVLTEPEREEMNSFLRDILAPQRMSYRGDFDFQGEEAMVYEVSLDGGALDGLAYVWHCRDNGALYLAAVAYPPNSEVDMEEPLSRLKTFHRLA